MIHFKPAKVDLASVRVNSVPVYCSLLSDQLTPVAAFERLAIGASHAFLLESVVGGEKIARYSFSSCGPASIVEGREGRSTVTRAGRQEVFEDDDPLERVAAELARYQTMHPPELPRFLGGAVGYAGYDVARGYEKVGPSAADDRGLPDVQFGLYDQMVIFDHLRKIIHVVAFATWEADGDREAAYDRACARIVEIVTRLGTGKTEALRPVVEAAPEGTYESTFTRGQFEDAVERCKRYIRAGDAFQVVLSQRLSTTTPAPPFSIYRALRVIAPSPFMFYLQTPSVTLVGSSPEVLCRIEGRTVSTRPLAGTRPRGRTEAEDRGLEAELLADPKERAEHVMLVDLGRNDLARICEPGTVRVDELMSVERFSHVMHICSNVSGTLAEGKTAVDAIRSVLPVGTVSGAPKIRAMQIIDELEPVRRGPYAGAVGYIDFAGNMDTCIALRTLVITPDEHPSPTPGGGGGPMKSPATRQWRVDAQVGAGIVADSEPAQEYQETLNKARGMLVALHMANAWTQP